MADWAIPQQAKLKYTQLFNLHDRNRTGFLSGLQCRDILLQSGLPRNILAEIWNLSDIDGDGQLTREEFILAMHLTNHVRSGQTLPTELPADLVPPSYRRARSISATSVHSTNSASSAVSGSGVNTDDQAATTHKPLEVTGSVLNSNSFEDKRRENFEKGRAELERRRLKMIEQQSSILNEQLVARKKQVAEAKGKIDSMRSERDTKAGLITSLEAQLLTVSDRKAFLDHEELSLIAIAKDLNLVKSAHETELDQQATLAKQESIKLMKEKLIGLEQEKGAKSKELTEITLKLDEFKNKLSSISEEVAKSYEIYKSKVAEGKSMRQKIIEENKSKTIDLDSVWDSTPSFMPAKLIGTSPKIESDAFGSSDDPWASTGTATKPPTDEPFAFSPSLKTTQTTTANNNNNIFDSNRDSSALSGTGTKASESTTIDAFGSGFSDKSLPEPTATKKYRALYAFDARNPDELTINPGDIIVGSEAVCEPGWLAGEFGGRTGLFPEAYVEMLPAEDPSDFDEAFGVGRTSSTSRQKTPVTTQGESSVAITKPSIKYKVIYAFDARNPDELTINPGDIIAGVEGPHEPGWLMGELNGQKGLFPEAYVEKLAEAVQAEPPQMTEQTPGVSLFEDLL